MTWMVFILCAIKLREPNDDYGVQAYLAMELLGAVCLHLSLSLSLSLSLVFSSCVFDQHSLVMC